VYGEVASRAQRGIVAQ